MVDLRLDRLADALAEVLYELEVLCVVGAIAIEGDRLQEPDLELRRQVHHPGGGPGPRESVVHGEVDEAGETLQQRHVREDRHGLLGPDHGYRNDRNSRPQRRLHEAAAAEATQLVALPVQLARALLSLGEDE